MSTIVNSHQLQTPFHVNVSARRSFCNLSHFFSIRLICSLVSCDHIGGCHMTIAVCENFLMLHIKPGFVSNVVQCSYRHSCLNLFTLSFVCFFFVEVFLFCYRVLEGDSSVCCKATLVDICSGRWHHWCIRGVAGAVSLVSSMLTAC